MIKVLNLYAGIGGNRKLWENVEVTAIEHKQEIADIYKDFFPQDKVIVADAHKYLEEHFQEFDFIWSSPPCPSHSKLRKSMVETRCGAKPIYPDMKLYEEILFLQGYFKGKWVVENVRSWYEPLIKPSQLSRHYYWSNFGISKEKIYGCKINLTGGHHVETGKQQVDRLQKELGFDLSKYNIKNKRLLLRNCVEPKAGKHIFDEAFNRKRWW